MNRNRFAEIDDKRMEDLYKMYDMEQDPQEMLLEITMSTEPTTINIPCPPRLMDMDFDADEDVPW